MSKYAKRPYIRENRLNSYQHKSSPYLKVKDYWRSNVSRSEIFAALVSNEFKSTSSEKLQDDLLKDVDLEKIELEILNGTFDWKESDEFGKKDFAEKITVIATMFLRITNLLSIIESLFESDDQSIEKLHEMIQKYKDEKERLKNIIIHLQIRQQAYIDALKNTINDEEKMQNESDRIDMNEIFSFPKSVR